MPHPFDQGYTTKRFRTLCENYPGPEVYPPADFRLEWGPVFHRGRLDGSARVLVIGQDPAQHEIMTRRILIGEAGQRVQGFLAKLGIERSYVMLNTFLYSVYGQFGGGRHLKDPGIVEYRNRWIDAVLSEGRTEAVVALGSLADGAWQAWKATPNGAASDIPCAHVTHPTQPEGSSKGDKAKRAAALAAMLQNWNEALQTLRPALAHPDVPRDLVLYGADLRPEDLAEIPEADLPAGTPAWMRGTKSWARRTGTTPEMKRVTITVTVPTAFRP
jgi:hypothetical protein